jgi:AraC family transcriptional regulator
MLSIHLLRYYTSVEGGIKEPSQGLTHQQMKRVIDFVHEHLSQNLSLEALAQQAGFSPYYFARLFRQTTGESPHQFVLRQRIEQAQRLLKERDVPLAHVALESGFANQSHLTQAFKRHLGLTPRAYRQDRSIRADF